MAHEAFISYSSKDKPIADAVTANLESAGIRCWIAPRDVTPGRDWDDEIVAGIDSSQILILIFSSSSNISKHVKSELHRAIKAEIPLVPFRIEPIEPSGGLGLHLAHVHWLDALTPNFENHLKELVKTVSKFIHITPPGSERGEDRESIHPHDFQPEPKPVPNAPLVPTASGYKTILAWTCLAVMIIGAGLYYFSRPQHRHPGEDAGHPAPTAQASKAPDIVRTPVDTKTIIPQPSSPPEPVKPSVDANAAKKDEVKPGPVKQDEVKGKESPEPNSLINAAAGGRIDSVKALLDKGMDLNFKDSQGSTALMLAARNNQNPDIVRLLLDKGADVNRANHAGWTALMLAVRYNEKQPDIVKLLLAKGANVDAKSHDEYTPLMIAAGNNDRSEIATLLLNSGAKVNSRRKSWTPLMLASSNGKTKIVKCLLEKGADEKARNSDGHTAEQIALMSGKKEVVDVFIEKRQTRVRSSNSRSEVAKDPKKFRLCAFCP